MKNLFTKGLALTLMASIVLFTSCKDDDNSSNTPEAGGTLTVGTTTVDLESALLTPYGPYTATSYNIDLELASVEIDEETLEPIMDGSPIADLYLEVFTDNAATLSEGIYTYSLTGDAFTFDYGDVTFDVMGEDFMNVNAGTLTILRDGNTYEITFEGTTADGTNVSAYYKGKTYILSNGENRAMSPKAKKKALK
ncbi:hypothetical protein [Neptunitalea lumnitzerae]|uniref:Lipocalin-like domain-containing protein n=1 Tax=Neptunitalea lumnitzerae TaxID=2965509 RepID=A0ABQ5MGR8_9FLAO|nr:hypothetical protein [Neptunitalea sp. Y10]GLB48588.1 hypothetical protein Y10_09560 [Neptunitalea sp. Y10]